MTHNKVYFIVSRSGTDATQYVTPALTYTEFPILFGKMFTDYREAVAWRKKYGTGGRIMSDETLKEKGLFR